jgi:hypothetical protein
MPCSLVLLSSTSHPEKTSSPMSYSTVEAIPVSAPSPSFWTEFVAIDRATKLTFIPTSFYDSS